MLYFFVFLKLANLSREYFMSQKILRELDEVEWIVLVYLSNI